MKTVSSERNYSKLDLWNSSTVLKLLCLFLENPKEEYYGSEVSRKTGVSTGATSEKLKDLHKAGLLNKRKEGSMSFYSLNREDSSVRYLKVARNLSKPLCEKLGEIGEKLGAEIYVYGSAARGEDREGSDWDLLVIGDVSSAEVQEEMDKLEDEKEINTSIFTRSEWEEMSEDDPAFYERVEKDKIGPI